MRSGSATEATVRPRNRSGRDAVGVREELMALSRRIWIPQVVTCVMLLWALSPANPYGYYVLLRWVCCAVFAYLAVCAHRQKLQGWVWVLGITAALYNPFVPAHLGREVWTLVNLATIAVAVGSVVKIRASAGG